MENKKTALTPVLEKVSALALLIIAIINVLEFVASAFRSASAAVIILNISIKLTGFIFVTIPLIVIAVIVLRGKLRAPESKKPISIVVIVSFAGSLLTGILSPVLNFFSVSGRFEDMSRGVKKMYYWVFFRNCITNLLLVLAAAAISLIILDALLNKIKWKSSLPLIIITYVLLMFSMWSYGLLFLILVSIFLRREDKTHPAVPSACVSGLLSVALMLVKRIVSLIGTVGMVVGSFTFSLADANSFYQAFSYIGIIVVVIGFVASLAIPLLYLGRAVPGTEDKPAETVSLAKE